MLADGAAVAARPGERHRHPPRPVGDGVEDPGRRRRGDPAGIGLGLHRQGLVLRRGQVGGAAEGPGHRGGPDAPVRARRGLSDAVPAAGPGRSRSQPVRALLGLRRAAAGPGAAAVGADDRVRPALLPWPGRARRAAQDVGQRAARQEGQDRFLGEGRAMAYADDPAWSGVLAELWRQRRRGAAGGAGGRGRGAEALVEDLAAADRGGGDAVAALPGAGRSVAAHVARIGRLPLVEALAVSGPPPTEDAASSVRAEICWPVRR